MDLPPQSSWGYFLSTDGPPADTRDVVVVEEGVHVGVVVGGGVGGVLLVLLTVALAVKRGAEMVELVVRHLSALFTACARVRGREDINHPPTPPPRPTTFPVPRNLTDEEVVRARAFELAERARGARVYAVPARSEYV